MKITLVLIPSFVALLCLLEPVIGSKRNGNHLYPKENHPIWKTINLLRTLQRVPGYGGEARRMLGSLADPTIPSSDDDSNFEDNAENAVDDADETSELIEQLPKNEEMAEFESILGGQESPAASAAAPTNTDHLVTTPFPGVVTMLRVKPGDVVERGSELMAVEAMNARNVFVASILARVAKVNVREGDKVEKDQVMIEFSNVI